MSSGNLPQPAGMLTLADIVRFQYFHVVRRYWPVAFLVAFALLLSLLGIVAVLITGDPQRLKNPGLMWALGLVWALLVAGNPSLAARRQRAKQQYLKEPMRYYFREDRVRLEAPSFSSELTWPLVQAIHETKTLFLIYQSPQLAWILPKRFFWGDEHELARWKKFTLEHLSRPDLFHSAGLIGSWI